MEDAARQSQTEVDIRAEGARLARNAAAEGVPFALLGGVAIWLRSPSMHEPPLAREYNDLDVAIPSSARSAVTRFLEAEGYTPEKRFNALHGASRLIFVDQAQGGRHLDVIVDRFTMCHTLDLRQRITVGGVTLLPADLLLTKLQIVELNEKDLRDILGLLADHAIGSESDEIDITRILAVTGNDWGLEHTIRRTLTTVRDRAGWPGLEAEVVERIRNRVDDIVRALDEAPKGMRWRARAKVGERVRWYELPEEVQ